MDKITVGIVGGGVVGSAMSHVYDRPDVGVTCKLHDIVPERSKHPLNEVLGCDVIMVCLPTPLDPKTGRLDIKAIDDFFNDCGGASQLYILRSTVPIGTCRELSNKHDLKNLVYMPEFLTERTALEDAECPEGLILAGAMDDLLGRLIDRIYPQTPTITADSYEVVELAKLSLNAFYAVKLSFFNELRCLFDEVVGSLPSEKRQDKYNLLIDMMCLVSDMLERSHTQVPGPDGLRGFGGKCLPKDTSQLIQHMYQNEVDPVMCVGAIVRCLHDRRPPTQEPAPVRDFNKPKRLWIEDDATRNTPGHVYIQEAWVDLFGEPLPDGCDTVIDRGDVIDRIYTVGNRKIRVSNHQGAYYEITELLPSSQETKGEASLASNPA